MILGNPSLVIILIPIFKDIWCVNYMFLKKRIVLLKEWETKTTFIFFDVSFYYISRVKQR